LSGSSRAAGASTGADCTLEVGFAHLGAAADAERCGLVEEVALRRLRSGRAGLWSRGRRLRSLSAERLAEVHEQSSEMSRQASCVLIEDPLEVVEPT
jgi:hypothetical protein